MEGTFCLPGPSREKETGCDQRQVFQKRNRERCEWHGHIEWSRLSSEQEREVFLMGRKLTDWCPPKNLLSTLSFSTSDSSVLENTVWLFDFAVVLFLHCEGHLRGGWWITLSEKYFSLDSATCLQNSLGTTFLFCFSFLSLMFFPNGLGRNHLQPPHTHNQWTFFLLSPIFYNIIARWPVLGRSYFLSCLSG